MNPSGSFARGVLFAALAAALWLPWALLVGPLLGVRIALAIYLAGATAAYIASISLAPARRAVAAAFVFAAAMVVAIAAPTAPELVLGLAVIIGVARGLLHPGAPARVASRETLLLVAGLLVARTLAAPPLVSIALALWGFLLVQSFFFLGGGRRSPSSKAGDGFEEARRRTIAMLEREPGREEDQPRIHG